MRGPKESLEASSQDSTGTGSEPLYGLFSSTLKARRVHSNIAGFRRMTGVLLTTVPYRRLCKEAIAKLAGVQPYLVKE